MSDSGSKQTRSGVITALVVTGFGIGWLAGLSVSPVVSIVLTTVTGSVATIVAALSGVKDEFLKPENSTATLRRLLRAVTPVPLAWLVAGLIVGSIGGVWARTHDWLGRAPLTDVQAELQFWRQAGLDEPAITRRLFEHRYGVRGWPDATLDAELDRWATATGLERGVIAQLLFESSYSAAQTDNMGVKTVDKGSETASFQSGVLFAVSVSDCTDIQNEEGSTLSREMNTATPQLAKVAEIITDTVVLERMVKEVLCAGG